MDVQTVSPFIEALFGGSLIAGAGSGMYSMPDCASDQRVDRRDLAATMFAYAFLTMRENGQIEMTIAQKRVLFVNHSYVTVRRTGAAAPTNPLLAEIYDQIVDGKSVSDTIRAWYKRDVYDPHAIIVQAATREAIADRYLQQAQPLGLGGKIAASLKPVIATTRVDEKRADIENIRRTAAERWQRFKSQDALLVDEVLEQCRRALAARVQQYAPTIG